MHDLKVMKQFKLLFKLIFILLLPLKNGVALLHRKLYAVVVDEYIEPGDINNSWSNSQGSGHKH